MVVHWGEFADSWVKSLSDSAKFNWCALPLSFRDTVLPVGPSSFLFAIMHAHHLNKHKVRTYKAI